MTLFLQRSLAAAVPRDIAVRADNSQVALAEARGHQVIYGAPIGGALASVGSYALAPAQGLAFPEAVAYDSSGRLLVSDLFNRRVVRYSPAGAGFAFDAGYPLVGGAIADGVRIGAVRALAVDTFDRVYLLDTPNRRIVRFAGAALSVIALPAGIALPWSLALTANGFCVVDLARHRVWMLDASGMPLTNFGGYGQARGQLRFPQDATLTPAGTVLVADTDNGRLQEFEIDGVYVGTAFASSALRSMRRLVVGPDGTIYVADPGAGAVHVLATNTPRYSLRVGRSRVEYGSVGPGETAATEFGLYNEGSQSIDLEEVQASGTPFAATVQGGTLPATLSPGDRRTVRVTFTPQASGPASGSVTVRSTAIPPVTAIPLAGTATQPGLHIDMAIVIDRGAALRVLEDRLLHAIDLVLPLFRPPMPSPRMASRIASAAVIAFAGRAVVELPLTLVTDITGNGSQVPDSLLELETPSAVSEALHSAFDVLSAGSGVVILVTDGQYLESRLLDDLTMPSGVVVHVVALGDDAASHIALASLAERSGGAIARVAPQPRVHGRLSARWRRWRPAGAS